MGNMLIPASIRREVDWLKSEAKVSVSTNTRNEIVISPQKSVKKVNWDNLWKRLRIIQQYKGANEMSLSQIIIEDRQRH